MPVGLLGVLILGFAVLSAPPAALLGPVPVILLCIVAVRKDLRHVRRYGWGSSSSGGSNGEGRPGGPTEPLPPAPSGDGDEFDWDAFVVQFRDHAERQPVA